MGSTRILIGLAATLLVSGVAFLAQGQNTLQPLIDAERKCGVFAPPQIAKTYPHVQWNGAVCVNRMAHGEGFVTFARDSATRPLKVWQGNFHFGFFIGDAKVLGTIRPFGESGALVQLPAHTYAEGLPWLLTRLLHDGPLPVCGRGVGEVAIEAARGIVKFEEALLRKMMRNAAIAYRMACPQPIRLRFAVVEAGKLDRLANGSFAGANDVVARGTLAEGAPVDAIDDFYNGAFSPDHEKRRDEQHAASRRAWQAFSRANWVVHWVKLPQLAAAPPHYRQKIVAFPARFARMVAPRTALLRDDDGEVMVRDIPDDALRPGQAVVIAGRSLGLLPLPMSANEISTVEATAWKPCELPACADFIGWMEGERKPFPWGQDQSQY